MVLLQVDGQLSVAGLLEKIGNENLVFNALRELERDGFITLSHEPSPVLEESKQRIREIRAAEASRFSKSSGFDSTASKVSAYSQFSKASQFSVFDKPILPAIGAPGPSVVAVEEDDRPAHFQPVASGPTWQERIGGWLGRLRNLLGTRLIPQRSPKPLLAYRPVSWGRRILLGVFGLVLAAFVLLIIFPYNTYRPSLELTLEQALGIPVKIGEVDLRLAPRPGLVLQDVRLGRRDEARIGTIYIPKLLAWIESGPMQIETVDVHNVRMSADFFSALPRLAGRVRDTEVFSLGRLGVSGLNLRFGDVELRDLAGEIRFETQPPAILLETADRGLRLQVRPDQAGALVIVEGTQWKPGEASLFLFSRLEARVVLQSGKLTFDHIDAGLMDGTFQGTAALDWAQGMRVNGEGTLSRISVRKLAAALGATVDADGLLSGKLRLQASGSDWIGLWKQATGELAFTVDNGVFNGIDIGEASRRGGEPVRGGSTKFERLTGILRVDPLRVRAEQLLLDGGLVQANGDFLVLRETLDAESHLVLNIRSTIRPIRMPIRASGKLPVLQTEAVK